MKRTIVVLIFLFAIALCPGGFCQSPFAAEDLNSLQSFYGYWEGNLSFPNLAEKKPVVVEIVTYNDNTTALVLYDKEQATATRYYISFENGVIRFPFTVVSMDNTKDSCKGTVSLSLLDGQHLSGSFHSTRPGCTALQVAAVKTDERVTTGLKNYRRTDSYNDQTEKFLGTWEGVFYQKKKDTTDYKVEYLTMINQKYNTKDSVLATYQIVEDGQTHKVHYSDITIKSIPSKEHLLLTWEQRNEDDSSENPCPISLKMKYVLRDGFKYLIGDNGASSCFNVKLFLRQHSDDLEATATTPRPSPELKKYFTNIEMSDRSNPNIVYKKNKIVDKESEKAIVKQGARAFYRWYESGGRSTVKEEAFANRMMITTTKKVGTTYKVYCPCRVDTKVVSEYLDWVKTTSPVSAPFLETWRKNLLSLNQYFNLKKEAIDKNDLLWFYESCYYIDGQDYPDGFAEMGFFDDRALWDIEFQDDGTALAKTTFNTKPDWGSQVHAFQIKMVKEDGVWKLASTVNQEVAPNPSFRLSGNVKQPTVATPVQSGNEQTVIKAAVREFLKWYAQKGEKHPFANLVLNKAGKPSGEEDICPCSINTTVLNSYTAWLKQNSNYFGANYLSNFMKEVAHLKATLQKAKEVDYGIMEEAAIMTYPLYVGNGDNPDFVKEGFYTDNSKIKWDIKIQPGNKAMVLTTLPGSDYRMYVEMVRENGSWKLARPVSTK